MIYAKKCDDDYCRFIRPLYNKRRQPTKDIDVLMSYTTMLIETALSI